jgi:Type IX secretion system membrane protein PorP/SprF
MKKHLIIAIIPLTFMYINTQGQFSHREPNNLSFGLSISTNYHHITVTDLNTFLQNNDLKEIKTGYLNLGAGLNFKYGRHFIQFSGDFDVNETTEYNENDIGTSGYGYAVNINYGYELGLFGEIKLVPYLGISRTIFKTKITDKVQSNVDFQSITTDRNSISIDNDTFSVNPGLRILMPIGDSDFSYCGLDINYGFKTNNKWTIDESKISNGPTINPSGLKIGIILMFMICR